MTHENIR